MRLLGPARPKRGVGQVVYEAPRNLDAHALKWIVSLREGCFFSAYATPCRRFEGRMVGGLPLAASWSWDAAGTVGVDAGLVDDANGAAPLTAFRRRPPMTSSWVLVPVKAFHHAKRRLSPVLDATQRADLARNMAERVLAAARPLPTAVVCDDPAVRAWAEAAGVRMLWHPRMGLNGAVAAGVDDLAADGCRRVTVAHADLPLATSLAWVAAFPGVTLVPDRHDDGTNVVSIPARAGLRFAYGAGSFRAHAAEAARLRLGLRVVRDPALGWDVDLPVDLEHPPARPLLPLPG